MLNYLLFTLVIVYQTAGDAKEEKNPQPSRGKEAERRALAARFQERIARVCPYLRDETCLYDLLRLRPIQKELGIDHKQADRMAELKSDCDRSIRDKYNAAEGMGGEAAYEAYVFDKRTRAEALALIRESLTPAQHTRLRQLAFYSEIEYLGLDAALTDGVFAKHIGVNENQKTRLLSTSRRLMAEERETIKQLHLSLHQDVLALLAPEERKIADALLGRYFDFNVGNWLIVRETRDYAQYLVSSRSQNHDNEKEALKEASEKGLLVEFNSSTTQKYQWIYSKQVQTDLGLTDEQVAAVSRGKPLSRERAANKSDVLEAEMRLDEILSPEQQARFDQIIQHLRIASYGYAKYFTSADFASRTEMTQERRSNLQQAISNLEKENAIKVRATRQGTYTKAFDQLSTEQRAAAKAALGEFFYAPHYLFAYRRDDVK